MQINFSFLRKVARFISQTTREILIDETVLETVIFDGLCR